MHIFFHFCKAAAATSKFQQTIFRLFKEEKNLVDYSKRGPLLHSVEIQAISCHKDFKWNQFLTKLQKETLNTT